MRLPVLRLPALSWPVVLASVLVAAGVGATTAHLQVRAARVRFLDASKRAQFQIGSHLEACENLLYGARGLMDATGGFSRESFHSYCSGMGLPDRYPGLLGLTFTVPVAPGGEAAVSAFLERSYPGASLPIRPGLGFGADAVVVLAEPEAGNRSALGFNSASSPEQRLTLVRARDTGSLQASLPLSLAQGGGLGSGLVLRLPVYRGGGVPSGTTTRRRDFAGCFNAVFLLRDLAPEGQGGLSRGLVLDLRDVTEPGHPILLAHRGETGSPSWWQRLVLPVLHRPGRLEIGGRLWELDFSTGSTFYSVAEALLPLVAGAGCLLGGLLLAGLVGAQATAARLAREEADRLARDFVLSESRLQAVVDVLPDVLMILDDQGCFREVLTGSRELLAVEPERILGQRLDQLLEPALALQGLEMVERVLREGSVQDLEYFLATPSGERFFHARVAPLRESPFGRRCVLWAARDITEHRGQEQAFRQAQRLESLGVLAGGIAHDFNNILAGIQGYLGILRTLSAEGGDSGNFLLKAEACVGRGADLARQLLAYSGRGRTRLEPIDLNETVSHMSELLAVSQTGQVEVGIALAEEGLAIEGDPVQVQQVVMNLVTNAMDALQEGRGQVRIRTRRCVLAQGDLERRFPGQGLQSGTYALLEVEDEGCGMSPEVIERIFDPFFTTKPRGRGLGLSAIRGILKAHRAGIGIHSRPGEGTRIQVIFPLRPEGWMPVSPADAMGEATLPDFSGVLLIAEDEPALRETARLMVSRLGLQPLLACDGDEAWSLYQAHREEIAAAFLDLTMPGRSGTEVYRLIRGLDPDLPVVICSGYSREDIPEPTHAGERRTFLAKPYSFRQLQEALAAVMA
nr:CHASE domain-containing protein [uncultured Holophaga sp.]